jgi:hypothetical protein
MAEMRTIEGDNGEPRWEAKGNSYEVAAEHAAELAYNEGNEVGTELVVAEVRVVVGPGSHISDYIVVLKRPS